MQDGFCVHGKLLMHCNECYPAYQKEHDFRWWEQLKLNSASVETFRMKTYPLFVFTCGDPIEYE